MQTSLSCSTTPSSVREKQSPGHTAMHGGSEQCMQATEMLFSPATPSFSVTTRRRLTPHGTLFSALQAVTQPLHSMQRSASQMNFILAMSFSLCGPLDLTDGRLRLLHHRHAVVAVGRCRIDRLAANDRCSAVGVVRLQIDTLPVPREVERQPDRAPVDAFRDESLHADPSAGRRLDPDRFAVANAPVVGGGRIDLDKHLLLQLG